MGGFNYGGGKGDGTGWSSERGDGTTPGGGSHGTGGGANTGNGGGNKDSRKDPYIRDKNGVAVGIKHGYHAVPDEPVADESHGNHVVIGGGVHAEPDEPSPNDKGNGGNDSNGSSGAGSGTFFNGLPGHPNVADGGQLGGDNRDKHQYNSIVGNNIYAVIVDGNGEIKGTFFESGNESGNRKAREEQKDKAWQQVWAYLDEKKKAEAKAAAEAKAKADAEAEAKRQAEEEAKHKAAEEKAKADAEKDPRELNAENELNDVRNQINALDQERQRLEGEVNNKNAQVAHEKEEEAKNLALKEKIITPGDALSIEQRNWETDRWNDAQKNKAEADRLAGEAAASQGTLNDVNRRLGEARAQEGQKQQQLNDVRAQVAVEKAKAAADAEAKRKADEEAAAKVKADAEKVKDEKEALTKASEIVADVGEKLSEHLGDKYKTVAKDIADNIKNFQGKTIRSYDDAMKSLNKITSNPAMKINKADKDAIVNAWKNVNAQDTANKLGNLGKAFNVADKVMKIEKLREKSIEGYETGNWGPLMLEVESWVVGGLAAGVAVGIFSATLGAFALSLGAPAFAVGIAGIMVYGTVSALIDDKAVDKLNNVIISPAH